LDQREIKRQEVGENCIMRNFITHSSPSIIRIFKSRRMKWAGHAQKMGEKEECIQDTVEMPEGKTPLGIPKCRWLDNINTLRTGSQFTGYWLLNVADR
jgi:hypothetical protein